MNTNDYPSYRLEDDGKAGLGCFLCLLLYGILMIIAYLLFC